MHIVFPLQLQLNWISKDLKNPCGFSFWSLKVLLAIIRCIDHSEESCHQQEWLVQYIHLGIPYSRCNWKTGFPSCPHITSVPTWCSISQLLYTVIVQITSEQTVLIDTLHKFRISWVLPKAFARVPLLEGRALWVELSPSCRGRNHHLFISR